MAIQITRYVVNTENHPYEVVVEYDHTDNDVPVSIGTDDAKHWLSIEEVEQFRRDLGAAIRQAKDAR